MSGAVAIALAVALAAVALIIGMLAVLTRQRVSTPAERAVHATLHTASLAARSLRRGLDADSARGAAPHLRGPDRHRRGGALRRRRHPAGRRPGRRPAVVGVDAGGLRPHRARTPSAASAGCWPATRPPPSSPSRMLDDDGAVHRGARRGQRPPNPPPACSAPSARWPATPPASSSSPNSTPPGLGWTAPRCSRCGPRSARTSSTTRSTPSPRSCAPTPTAPAS